MTSTSAAPAASALDQRAPTPVAMVNALNGTFGVHPGKRASHAKGFCAIGEFTPSTTAADIVDSPLFRETALSAQLRFSIGGGNPNVSDKSRTVRGMALRLQSTEQNYDLVLISEPAFFAATPASFVSFLQARVADPITQKPDSQKIAAHNAAYPDGTRQTALLAAHAAPSSYATTPYFSNNAFIFTNIKGLEQHARIIVKPVAGTLYLSEMEEQSFPDQFLEDEMVTRLGKSPVEFTIHAQLPAPGDSFSDPSTVWIGAGEIELGRLRVTQKTADNDCDSLVFLPATLPRGIKPSDDPILQSRAAAYAVSLARRNK
jgi:catalase